MATRDKKALPNDVRVLACATTATVQMPLRRQLNRRGEPRVAQSMNDCA